MPDSTDPAGTSGHVYCNIRSRQLSGQDYMLRSAKLLRRAVLVLAFALALVLAFLL